MLHSRFVISNTLPPVFVLLLSNDQLLPTEKATEPEASQTKRKRGRPKGRKNYEKPDPKLSGLLSLFQDMLAQLQPILATTYVKYVVLDGKFGNYPSTWVVRKAAYHIISKMRHDANLYLPYDGPKPKRGKTPRYGQKLK